MVDIVYKVIPYTLYFLCTIFQKNHKVKDFNYILLLYMSIKYIKSPLSLPIKGWERTIESSSLFGCRERKNMTNQVYEKAIELIRLSQTLANEGQYDDSNKVIDELNDLIASSHDDIVE